MNIFNIFAQVAQLVEQATENRCVGGSIPPLGTTDMSFFRLTPFKTKPNPC